MKKTLLSLAAAAVIATGAIAAPQPAQAQWWIAPLIVGGLVGTVVVAGAATQRDLAYAPGYAPAGAVYVRPAGAPGSCRIMRERVPGGWRRVEVCY
jgi:hypothetical protein